MRVVVTGGSGKLAKYIVPVLSREHEILLFDEQRSDQSRYPFIQGEIIDGEKLSKAFQGADAIIHLAALRSRYNHLPMKVMKTNVLGTFCVLEEARKERVGRLVFSSSDAAIGIAQSRNKFAPDYLPIDENHPLRPQDPYGISKMLGEEMCRCYATGYGMNIIALRFSNILCPGDELRYLADAKDPSERHNSLWAWVHVEDAVQAIWCALMSDLPGYEVFHIASEDMCLSNIDISNLLKIYYHQTLIHKSLSGNGSLIDCNKAKHMLGFRQHKRFSDVIERSGSQGAQRSQSDD